MADSYLSSAPKLLKALLSNTMVGEGKDAAKSPLEGYEGTCLTRYSGMGIQNRSQWRRLSPEQSPYDIRQPVRHFGALVLVKAIFGGS